MAGASLLRLLQQIARRWRQRPGAPFRLVADHHINLRRRHNAAGRGDHVAQQRLAADFVQHFGPARFQPRPLARRHHHDGQLRVPSWPPLSSCSLLLLLRARLLRHRNGDVDGMSRPHIQRIQPRLDLRPVAHHQHRQSCPGECTSSPPPSDRPGSPFRTQPCRSQDSRRDSHKTPAAPVRPEPCRACRSWNRNELRMSSLARFSSSSVNGVGSQARRSRSSASFVASTVDALFVNTITRNVPGWS